ncbi:hypothetical protein SJS84_12605 [Aeromonas caviae]|uniref:hypothetical protein n=1 Tax=Aeromonas TaxID=642 RepID=UPI00244CF30E|nr:MULTISPECIES: hypothetical protein [Aeromonas]MDH1846909.1 hypothetical protein [Aeromonas caviae]MDU7580092.1 hypothetical protein [Aeromonas sp.]MDX7791543.1 hypothetical protein [Aeromonas caviae]
MDRDSTRKIKYNTGYIHISGNDEVIHNGGHKIAENIPLIISFLSGYILVVGASYTLGYWALFPINIFDYIGLVDIAKSSIPALMVSMLIISSQFISNLFTNKFSDTNDVVEKNSTTKFLVKCRLLVAVLFTTSITALSVLISSKPEVAIEYHVLVNALIWGVSILSPVLLYIFLVYKGYVERLNFSKYFYGLTILSLVFITTASFAVGFDKAIGIINGSKYSYVSSTLHPAEENLDKKDRYLGFYGGKYFLWEPNKKLVKIVSGEKELNIKAFKSISEDTK